MDSRQHSGLPIHCGRERCGRLLCRAIAGEAGEVPAVVLIDMRAPAVLTPAGSGPGPERRVHLTCRGQVVVRGIKRRCEFRKTLRLDEGPLVDAVLRPGSRRKLVLGVDV
jgi:hypothetical protein